MKKLFVDRASEKELLTGDDHLHVSVVLRARKGDELILCDGDGFDYHYEIVGFDKNSTKLKFLDKTEVETEPTHSIDLFVALPKGDKLELITQKCTELGINAIVPFVSEFVQAKGNVRLDRLNKIAREAAQQCGRGKVPLVHSPVSFSEMKEKIAQYDTVLFFYECGGSPMKDVPLGKKIALIVGSEGGFSDAEAKELGLVAHTISLGKRILRAETAAVVATALTMYQAEELQ